MILTKYRRPVKPHRHTAKPAAPFGLGLLTTSPVYEFPGVVDDLSYSFEALPDLDALAAEAVAVDRLSRGLDG